jgi:hypothetical protein
MNTILVLAGNRDQFNTCIEKQSRNAQVVSWNRNSWEATLRYFQEGPIRFIYVSSPEQILGMNGFGVWRVGKWWEHPKLSEIEEEIRMRQGGGE